MRSTLVQFLIPVVDQEGARIAEAQFESMRSALTERFGGVTAFVHSPALGTWKGASDANVQQDEVILVEVIVDQLDRSWWSNYRSQLEELFNQDEILMRALEIERLL